MPFNHKSGGLSLLMLLQPVIWRKEIVVYDFCTGAILLAVQVRTSLRQQQLESWSRASEPHYWLHPTMEIRLLESHEAGIASRRKGELRAFWIVSTHRRPFFVAHKTLTSLPHLLSLCSSHSHNWSG